MGYKPVKSRRDVDSYPDQFNPEIAKAIQQTMNTTMHGFIVQAVEATRQASGRTVNPKVTGGNGPRPSDTAITPVGTQLTLH